MAVQLLQLCTLEDKEDSHECSSNRCVAMLLPWGNRTWVVSRGLGFRGFVMGQGVADQQGRLRTRQKMLDYIVVSYVHCVAEAKFMGESLAFQELTALLSVVACLVVPTEV